MQDKQEQQIIDAIVDIFGEDYREASIAKIAFPTTNERAWNQLVEWLKNPCNFLVLTGKPGSGKTYFCASVYGYLYPKFMQPGRSMRAWHERKLLEEIKLCISGGGAWQSELKSKIDDDIIILDDVGSARKTDFTEDVLTEILDYRYSRNLTTIFTSNLDKNHFYETYHPRVGSRLFAKKNLILTSPDIDYREEGY